MHRALTDKNKEAMIIEWICQNDKEFDEAKSNGYDLRMDEEEIIYWMDKYAKAQTAEGGQADLRVMPKIVEKSYKPETPFEIENDGKYNLIYNLRKNVNRRVHMPEMINDVAISLSNNHHLTKEQMKEIAEVICNALNSNFSE